MIPFFLFGIYENVYGHLLNRVSVDFRVLGNSGREVPPSQQQPLPPDQDPSSPPAQNPSQLSAPN